MGYMEKIIYYEGDEALAQVAQRSCGGPVPGSVPGRVAQGSNTGYQVVKSPLILGDRDQSTSSTKSCEEFTSLLYSRHPAVFNEIVLQGQLQRCPLEVFCHTKVSLTISLGDITGSFRVLKCRFHFNRKKLLKKQFCCQQQQYT